MPRSRWPRWAQSPRRPCRCPGSCWPRCLDARSTRLSAIAPKTPTQADLQIRQSIVGRSFFAVTQAFFGISPALVYLVAGLQGTRGALSAGTLVAFTTLQSRLLIPINQLLQVSVDVQSSLALFGRIFELIDLRPRITDRRDALNVDAGAIHGEVALEHVSFRYGGGEDGGPLGPEEALHDVSMLVSPGQLAALVGPSGAGKTTISYLIPRLYDVERGAVTIDGHDVRDLTAATIARAVGVVTQESYLFGGTVRENISYGKPDASDEEIVAKTRRSWSSTRQPRRWTPKASASFNRRSSPSSSAGPRSPSRTG